MTDKVIIEEAIRLVSEGVSVTYPVNGWSMLPFIIGGKESVILQKVDKVQKGDVVLAWVNGNHYVVHRVIRICGDEVTLMGDGNLYGLEHCRLGDVKAWVAYVVDQYGKKRDINCRWRRRAASAWWWLRPIRRYILVIYRRIII